MMFYETLVNRCDCVFAVCIIAPYVVIVFDDLSRSPFPDHHDDGEGEHEDEHKDEHEDDHENEHEGDHENEVSTNCTSCDSVSKLVREVILKLNLTTAECLDHAHNDTPTDPSRVSDLEGMILHYV